MPKIPSKIVPVKKHGANILRHTGRGKFENFDRNLAVNRREVRASGRRHGRGKSLAADFVRNDASKGRIIVMCKRPS